MARFIILIPDSSNPPLKSPITAQSVARCTAQIIVLVEQADYKLLCCGVWKTGFALQKTENCNIAFRNITLTGGSRTITQDRIIWKVQCGIF